MSECKKQAIEVIDQLHSESRLEYPDYCTIHDGLDEIDTLRDRDEVLEELWAQFADIPMNPETECIEAPFMGWGVGISREEIWHWFDERHSKGVVYLLYGTIQQYDVTMERYYKSLCDDCGTSDCAYNSAGESRSPQVFHRVPIITESDGCMNYIRREGDG